MFSIASKHASTFDRVSNRRTGRPSIGRSNAHSGRHRSLRCEPLEDRRLLSVYSDLFKAPELVKDINTGTADAIHNYGYRESVVIGDTLYSADDDGIHGHDLWKTDGNLGRGLLKRPRMVLCVVGSRGRTAQEQENP